MGHVLLLIFFQRLYKHHPFQIFFQIHDALPLFLFLHHKIFLQQLEHLVLNYFFPIKNLVLFSGLLISHMFFLLSLILQLLHYPVLTFYTFFPILFNCSFSTLENFLSFIETYAASNLSTSNSFPNTLFSALIPSFIASSIVIFSLYAFSTSILPSINSPVTLAPI